MPVRHQVRLYDTGGNQVALFDTWRSMQVHKKINTFGEHTFTIDKKLDDRWRLFNTDCFVQLLRSDATNQLGWYEEYIGFHRTPQHQLTEQGNRLFTSYGRSLEDILTRHSVAYQRGTNIPNPAHNVSNPTLYEFTNKTGAADDVMKAYIRDNYGAGSVNIYRLRSGNHIDIIVPADTGLAPQWQGDKAYGKVLDVITSISQAAGVDFDIQLATRKPPTYIFHTHFPLLGTDRTLANPPIVLSPDRENVKTISLTQSRTDEVNVAVIVGSVDAYVPSNNVNTPGVVVANRVVFVGTSQGSFDSPWNDIELIRDARNDETALALSSAANQAYAALGAKESFVVTPLPNVKPIYGKDYFFGDKILVNFEGVTRIKKIVGVQIVSGGDSSGGSGGDMGEALTIELSDVDAPGNLLDAFHNISSRIASLEHLGSL